MRDITLIVLLLSLAAMAWRQPWLGVLALVFVAIVHPQGYATGFMQGFPAYLVLFGVVALTTVWQFARLRTWPRLHWDWRLAVLALLWGHFVLTTALGVNPWAGWPRLLEVSKRLPLLLLILLMIDTQEKLRWLLLTVALSIAALVLKGGFWALITGFQDRVYGPPGSQYSDNNSFAIVTTLSIPLLALWYRQSASVGLRILIGSLIALGFVSALSSWSRGGLLSLGVVALLLAWHSRRKSLAIPLLVVVAGLAFVSMPDTWLARMQTIATPELEESAATRLDLWLLGWNHALQNPWTGGGFEGWIYLSLPAGGGSRVWHSAYIDLLAEHGFVGLALWAALVVGSVLSLTWMIWQSRRRAMPGLVDEASMLRASIAAYLVGAAFLSIAYWEILFVLVASAILVSRFSNEAPGAANISHSC